MFTNISKGDDDGDDATGILTEIRDTVTSFNLFIRDLGHVFSISSCQKAHISNNMTAFCHPFLLSRLILRNCDDSRI